MTRVGLGLIVIAILPLYGAVSLTPDPTPRRVRLLMHLDDERRPDLRHAVMLTVEDVWSRDGVGFVWHDYRVPLHE